MPIEHILDGFLVAMQPGNLIYTFIGVFLGTIIGMLPGIGSSAGIALLIPISFGMQPTTALMMMAGVYYGAMYGDSLSAILINTPGEGAAVMTTIEGYKMAQKGRAGAALAVSAWGSFIAGTISVVALTLVAVPLAQFALRFGPAEYFMLMLFAMTSVSALSGASRAKAVFAVGLGLALSTVGIDLQTGESRFTLGIPELEDGLHFPAVVVGLFAVSEVLRSLERFHGGTHQVIRISGKLMLTREEWRRSLPPIFRGGVIGFVVGVLPGAGSTIATILSYSVESRVSKHRHEFGTGAIEGVAGPEAANNACTAGAMVPLLSLGLPGSATTAVMLGVLVMYGIQPGPLLFANQPQLVWGLVNSMYIGNVMLLILNLPLIGLFVRVLYIPTGMLMALILVIATLGSYGLNGSMADVYVMLAAGVLGYLMDRAGVPIAPLVLALVLGRNMEQSFRQAMTISDSSLEIFVRSGISVGLLLACLAAMAVPILTAFARRRSSPLRSNW
jgi:putative tricarboxylic transport membrane protein